MATIEVDWLVSRPGEAEQRGARIHTADQRIESIEPAAQKGNGLIALPGLSNAGRPGRLCAHTMTMRALSAPPPLAPSTSRSRAGCSIWAWCRASTRI